MLDFLPNATAFQIGPLTIGWYGIGYAVGLVAAYLVMSRLARRAGEDEEILLNGLIIVAFAALIGGRAYHVIDQWDNLYKDHIERIFLPPYSGLGVYGGIITGTIAAWLYARWKHVPFLRWADIVAPGLFTMQAIARWGNFFNQELYGSPTTLPWGIPIDCAHRIVGLPMRARRFPRPSVSIRCSCTSRCPGSSGLLVLVWIGYHLRHAAARRATCCSCSSSGTGPTRFILETLRHDNWTFFGIPTAQVVSIAIIVPALVILAWRHRRGHPLDDPPTHPEVATWGALGRPVEVAAGSDEDDGAAAGPADDDWAPDSHEPDADALDAPEAPAAATDVEARRCPTRPIRGRTARRPEMAEPGPAPEGDAAATAAGARIPRGDGRGARRRRRRPRLAGPARPRPTARSCTASCGWSPGSSSSWSSGSGSGRPGRETSRAAAICSWPRRIAAGWTRSS